MKAKITKWIKGLFLFAAASILILSLVSFSKEDFFLYTSPPHYPPANFIGIAGVYIAGSLIFLFGYAAYLIVIFLALLAIKKLGFLKTQGLAENTSTQIVSAIINISALSFLLAITNNTQAQFNSGGLIGYTTASFSLKYLGNIGSYIIGTTLFVTTLFLLEGEALLKLVESSKNNIIKVWNLIKEKKEKKDLMSKNKPQPVKTKQKKFKKPSFTFNPKKQEPKKKTPFQPKVKNPSPVTGSSQQTSQKYAPPNASLLHKPASIDEKKVKENIKVNAANLENTLANFGIEARVVNVERGPVITCYELEPAPGIKITKISALSDDIALSLKSSNVRVVAPLPGKGTIGVEVPNDIKHTVFLREVIEDKKFAKNTSRLTLAIGKDAGGAPLIANLKEMPHLLIAGTTGSGKTVCVNSLISSILFKSKPTEVKFLLIDPKMVELAPFSEIPHLLAPVISNPKKAKGILKWATEEMEKRYSKLAEAGARNLDIYNSRKSKSERIPYIVIVVDELADLMAIAREDVETAILRLAQLARAVGIHLILATQRPSVDVVTGVIKANFPARISFKVASKMDSRTVLDVNGADKLLGKGDLLFIKPSLAKPIRAQSCYLADEEIENLVKSVKKQEAPQYDQEIMNIRKKPDINIEEDELTNQAIKIILETNQASASLLQRRLRIGYTRAARILDLMEQKGIVGPFQGSKARSILVDKNEYLNSKIQENNNGQ